MMEPNPLPLNANLLGRAKEERNNIRTWSAILVIGLGIASILPYLYAWTLQDLRQHTVAYLVAFVIAFALYGAATILVLKMSVHPGRWYLGAIFCLALVFNTLLIFTPPTLSDDMYRYVWDGRLQAQGISPYRYAPDNPELLKLRDSKIWRFINRRSVVTVYPPAAEFTFALLWRLRPDSVRWFQLWAAGMAILAGALLLGLLRDLKRSPGRVLIYLWAPLLIFETAHAAHIDGLILPLLVGAWWARIRERDGLVGVLLGLGTAMKFYPILLFPALWRPRHRQGRWRMPLAFITTMAIFYLPYWMQSGADVVGFLPEYVRERFNISPPLFWLLNRLPSWLDLYPESQYSDAQRILSFIALATLGLVSLIMILKPAISGEQAVRRSIWPIGIFTLFNLNLFPWYLLWLLPLVAIFMDTTTIRFPGSLKPSGSKTVRNLTVNLIRLDSWTGWWLLTGLVALSYTFFIRWETVPLVSHLQFWPLYAFLLADLLRWLRQIFQNHPAGGGAHL
jgi:alpha-1,6-mannosyltransferase